MFRRYFAKLREERRTKRKIAMMKELLDRLPNHVGLEQRELLPRARRRIPREDLAEISAKAAEMYAPKKGP